MAQIVDIASLLLDSTGPRDAAQRTLSWLMASNQARSVALFRAEGDALSLDLSVGADDETLSGARKLWEQHREALASGTPALESNRALIPARPAGMFVYLDGVDPKRLDLAGAADGGTVAVRAMQRPGWTAGRPGGKTALFRDELIATLRLHEWNIARVARVKRVTRKTIYDWIQKYDIPRERIPKT